jgi:serine/threonine protein kinase
MIKVGLETLISRFLKSMTPENFHSSFHVGQLINSRFLVCKVGQVHDREICLDARDTLLDNIPVTLKMFHIDSEVTKKELERFRSELIITRRLNHPSIETVHDIAGYTRDCLFISAQKVEGIKLSTFLDENQSAEIQFSMILSLFYRITHALKTIHENNIIHRLLSPDTIMVTSSELSSFDSVILTNFGHAKLIDKDLSITRTGEIIVKNPVYAAPEQIRGERIDQRADLYSLGMVTLCLMLGKTIQAPYKSTPSTFAFLHIPLPDIRSIRKDIPEWFIETVEKLCSKNKNKRFQSATELQLHILEALDFRKKALFEKRIKANRSLIRFPFRKKNHLWRVEKLNLASYTLAAILLCFIGIYQGTTILEDSISSFSQDSKNKLTKEFFHVVMNGKDSDVFSLLSKGANPHIHDERGTPLINIAVELGHNNVVYTLLSHTPQIITMQDRTGRTPLHIAIEKNNIETLSLLLRHNPDINISDFKGRTPKEFAESLERSAMIPLFD